MTDQASPPQDSNDTDPAPRLDPGHVAELMALDAGEGAMFRRFVELFLARAQERLVDLAKHAQAADAAGLAGAAHLLRGGAGSVGAVRLAVALGQVEAAARSGDLPAAGRALVRLDAEYAATRAELLDAVARSRA